MRAKVLMAVAFSTLLLAVPAAQSQSTTDTDQVFRYAYRVDPATLDPHAMAETFTLSWLGQIYEPLVGRGKNLELVPALAASWEQPNPTTWRFHLRKDATFANGAPFTVEDAIFSINRAKMEGSDVAYTVASVKEIKKVDDWTLDLITQQPNPILPNQITSTYMMSKSWADENNAATPASVKEKKENFASTNANGTGAFHIVTRQAGVKTELASHEKWWGNKEHNLGKVIFTPI